MLLYNWLMNQVYDSHFIEVCENGQEKVALNLLPFVNPNTQNSKLETPLHIAAELNLEKIASALVTHSLINPNIVDYKGNTPLHISCFYGSNTTNIVAIHPATNLNIQNYQGETPLIIATKKYNPTIVNMLLLRGADPNIQDSTGKTALMWACLNIVFISLCKKGHRPSKKIPQQIFRLIIKHLVNSPKINVNIQDHIGDYPLIILAHHCFEDYAFMFFDKTNIALFNDDGNTTLIMACIHRAITLATRLVLLAYDVAPSPDNTYINHKNKYNETALMWACKNKLLKTALEILEVPDIDIVCVDLLGNNALTYALHNNMYEVVDLIKKLVPKCECVLVV